MRRARPGFAWVSMMDLLFGLFGALVILTVLMTLKLGKDSGIEQKAFQLFTIEVTSGNHEVSTALARMAINLELVSQECVFGASFDNDRCQKKLADELGGVPVLFTTGVGEDNSLSATLFAGAEGELKLRPLLSNVPALIDLDPWLDDEQVSVRLHVKIGDAFWPPEPYCPTVGQLISLARNDPRGMAHLDICNMPCGPGTGTTQGACNSLRLGTDGG